MTKLTEDSVNLVIVPIFQLPIHVHIPKVVQNVDQKSQIELLCVQQRGRKIEHFSSKSSLYSAPLPNIPLIDLNMKSHLHVFAIALFMLSFGAPY